MIWPELEKIIKQKLQHTPKIKVGRDPKYATHLIKIKGKLFRFHDIAENTGYTEDEIQETFMTLSEEYQTLFSLIFNYLSDARVVGSDPLETLRVIHESAIEMLIVKFKLNRNYGGEE